MTRAVLQSGGGGERDRALRRRTHAEVERRRVGAEGPAGQPDGTREGHLHQEEQHLHRSPEVHDAPHALPVHAEAAGIPVGAPPGDQPTNRPPTPGGRLANCNFVNFVRGI